MANSHRGHHKKNQKWQNLGNGLTDQHEIKLAKHFHSLNPIGI